MFSKVEHYPLGSAGKAKLRMLAKLIPEIPYAKDLSGKTVIVCDDDKILWDFVSVKQGLIPDNYGLGLWNTVLYQFDRKGIPLDTIEFKKRGLMTALNKDMAREALIANGFNIIENEPKSKIYSIGQNGISDLDEVESGLVLTKLFANGSNILRAKNSLNQILKDNPKMKYTILALVLYPALKWSLYGENITDIMQNAHFDSDAFLLETQRILRSVFGVGKTLDLECRNKYFETCKHVIDEIDTAVLRLVNGNNEHGKQMAATLQLVMNESFVELQEPSKFEVKKYLPLAVESLHIQFGQSLRNDMDSLLHPDSQMFFQDDDEYLYAYHNTKLLLREYSRLYWARTGDDDVIVRVLHAKTPKEILSITQNERAMYSVDAVLQFLLLVSGAIALVEYYPIKGKQYADVLKLLVSNRSIILTDGTMAYLREKNCLIAWELHNVILRFSSRKQ